MLRKQFKQIPRLYENSKQNISKILTIFGYSLTVGEPECLHHSRNHYYKSSKKSEMCVPL